MDEQKQAIEAILAGMQRIAVVGISDNPARSSHEVAGYLVRQGFTVLPVNPMLKTALGIPCVGELARVESPVDVVDIFRRSSEAGAAVDEAIAIGARAVWLQEGVVDEDAAGRAREAGLLVVMDRCILKEHARRVARLAAEPEPGN